MKRKSTALAATFGFAILSLFSLFWYLGQPTAVYAIDYSVTKTDDTDGTCAIDDCSLREAIAVAATGDTILIPAGTYTLTMGELVIAGKDIALRGADPNTTIVASNGLSRVLNIDASELLLENLTVTNGQADEGAGMNIDSWSNVTLSNTVVISNAASSIGGGIYFNQEGYTLTLLNDSKVISNTATNTGGGIFVNNGDVVIEDGTVSYNTAGEAGGIAIQYSSSLYFNDGEISYNQTTITDNGEYPGGGIQVLEGAAYLNGGKITNNDSFRGGGVMVENGEVIQAGTLISDNTATYGGGVYVALWEAVFTQNSGLIQDNESTGNNYGGGGLYIYLGTANLFGGQVVSNTAVNDGGGMELRFGNLNIDGSHISNNQAGHWGGAIFNSGGTMTMTNTTIFNNQATLGGGIATNVDFDGPTASQNIISQSAILSNTATTDEGGGIHNRGYLTLNNSTVSGNNANEGAGIFNRISTEPEPAGTISLTNVTVGNNQATTSGGGVQRDSGLFSIANTIIVSNTNGDCAGTITTLDYNLTTCTLTGSASNDIAGDPLLQPLALNGGATLNYALGAGSPAIDAGNPALCPLRDQRNYPRPVDGDSNLTSICDIGAYEYGIGYFVHDLTIAETETTNTVNVIVERSYATTATTVEFDLTPGTATAGSDYTDTSGTLNFGAGVTTQTIEIDILGDTLDEFDETFLVNLSNPSAGTSIGDGEATVTISNDDAQPTVSIIDVMVDELDSPDTVTAILTASLSATSGKPITVAFSTTDDTAVAGSDYVADSGNINFTPGITETTIEIDVSGDNLDEFTEAFTVNLSPVTDGNVTIADGDGTVSIVDNDNPPAIAILAANVNEVDNGSSSTASFTVQLSAPSGKPISATYSTIEGSATAGAANDFIAVTNSALNFAPGETEKTIDITVNGDDLYEGNQTFSVELANLENIASSGNTTTNSATIQDNEAQPSISIASNSTEEGDSGTKTLEFVVTLSGAAEEDVTVTYATNHVTTDGSDFDIVASGTLTFTSPSTSETISITINGDEDSEDDETFEINLSNPTVATIGTDQAIGTILDDDGYFIFLPMVVKP